MEESCLSGTSKNDEVSRKISPLRKQTSSDTLLRQYQRERAQNTRMLKESWNRLVPNSRQHQQRNPSNYHTASKLFQNFIEKISSTDMDFPQLKEVKVALSLGNYLEKQTLENLADFREIVQELRILWRINRSDMDLLEYLLGKANVYDQHASEVESYKEAVDYDVLPASSEREITTLISSLHNLLQSSQASHKIYTTVSLLHHGDVYSFNRTKLVCIKEELSFLLNIDYFQITYIGKTPEYSNGFTTVFQMSMTAAHRLVVFARQNNASLMGLGIKGVQLTGSDGLRYTQSMGQTREKVFLATRSSLGSSMKKSIKSNRDQSRVTFSRTISGKDLSETSSSSPQDSLFPSELLTATPINDENDRSLLPLIDPDDQRFERRVELVRNTITKLSQPQTEELLNSLLDQIGNLNKQVSGLRKDLQSKTRKLNIKQSYAQKAEKEMKAMEMKLEMKAQQISDTNNQLVKRLERMSEENNRLRNIVSRMNGEMDVLIQMDQSHRMQRLIQVTPFKNHNHHS